MRFRFLANKRLTKIICFIVICNWIAFYLRTTAAPAQPSKTINVMPFIVDKQRSDYSDSDSQSEIDDTENEQVNALENQASRNK